MWRCRAIKLWSADAGPGYRVFCRLEVVRLEVFEVWMPLVSEFRTSFGSTRLRPALLVRAVEKGGEEGWG
ncbi:O-succinylbenzoate synthase, partial [Aeropyrum pernix]